MNFKKRYLDILDFLKTYQTIWQNEILLMYPHPFNGYPMDWVEELARFTDKNEVMKLEKKEVQGLIKHPELLAFYEKVEELCQLPKAPDYPPMPEDSFTYLYMIPKKQYEIKRLAPAINHLYHTHHIERIVDIGGGIGLLAQTLTNQYNLTVSSLDLDPVLQETGKKRHQKNFRYEGNRVSYHTVRVHSEEESFLNLLNEKVMTVGLHTCGALANDQIMASSKKKIRNVLSMGCCYHKLEKVPGSQNISQFAKDHGALEQSRFALTLASRAHRKMEEKDYDLKQKVKLYRYALHFLLHDEYEMKEFVTFGNSSPKLYDESFGTYALEQFSRINLVPKHSKAELDEYFKDPARQTYIWKMVAAGLIRNAFGRLLEIQILLDRAIYLEENGYGVEMLEFFEEDKSPRNIALLANRL